MKMSRSSLRRATIALVLGCVGCSSVHVTPSTQQSEQLPTPSAENELDNSINLVEFEKSNPELQALPIEVRALRLSSMWYQRATHLSPLPGPSYAASLLRVAHYALEGLLSERCNNPFNRVCGSLDAAYTQAVADLVRQLAGAGWKLPDLAPSRYRFASSDSTALERLWGWKITLPNNDFDPLNERPGLGLATIGCRDTTLPIRGARDINTLICSPVTFVLLFDSPSSDERISARLMAIDGYQQEVVQVQGREILVRAQVDSTLGALQRNLVGLGGSARLSCLSLPTRGTATILVTGSASDISGRWIDQVRAISRQRDLTANVSSCFLSMNGDEAASRSARDVLEVLREIIAPRDKARLEQQPIELYLAGVGKSGMSLSLEIIRRMARRASERRHSSRHGTPFVVRGIIADPIASGSEEKVLNELALASSNAQIPLVVYDGGRISDQDQAEHHTLYRLLRSTLTPAFSDGSPIASTPSPAVQETAEPLEMSPVL